MKISDVRPLLTMDGPTPAVLVKIETDCGLVGYGEATMVFMPKAIYGLLKDLRPHLLGEDPERIEHLWQMCFRRLFARGGPVTGAALSGIDQALWDLKGKALKAPVYQLLGGLAREKVRLYGHVTGRSPQEIADQARDRYARGLSCIRYRGFHTYDDVETHDHAQAVAQQVEYLHAIREAVGYELDVIVECHGRYDPEWALSLARQIEPLRPFALEDPIRHENPAALAEVRAHTSLPIAMGERWHNKWEFREAIINRYITYARPDVCWAGGISEMVKIGALAEAFYVNLIPHNNAGPLGTAATLHASLAIPNVTMMEAPFANSNGKTYVAAPYPLVRTGYAYPLEGPGLGVTVDEAAAEAHRYTPRRQVGLRALDGSVRDW